MEAFEKLPPPPFFNSVSFPFASLSTYLTRELSPLHRYVISPAGHQARTFLSRPVFPAGYRNF